MSFSVLRLSLRSLRRSPVVCRAYSTVESSEIREKLMAEVKTAMKARDTFTTTIIRSVLAEVYAADKATPPKIASSAIMSILRKATLRRTDAAAQFVKASRPDLAEKEQREAAVLSAFLPPLMSQDKIDEVLSEVITVYAPDGDKKKIGRVFGSFYKVVDKSSVDADLVKTRAEALMVARIL